MGDRVAIVALALALVAAGATPAAAMETVTLLLVTAYEVSQVTLIGSLTVGQVALNVALVGAQIGLQLLNRPGLPQGSSTLPQPDALHQPLRQAMAPRVRAYGRARLAGAYMLYEASGYTSYDVQALHHGRIAGIVGYYLHDDVVTIDGSGYVDEQGSGAYAGDTIRILTRLGAATETAYSEITGVPALAAIWTADHRGDGIASAALICAPVGTPDKFSAVYPRHRPELSLVVDGAPVFDWRDGAQSVGDADTWQVSANPVIQAVDYFTHDAGMGEDRAVLIDPVIDALSTEASICDEEVTRADGGSEPRYASNGSYALDTPPSDVLAALLAGCDGWISENGDGTLAFWVGKYRAPRVTLTSDHVTGVRLQYGETDESAVNELVITYTEPQLDYKTAPGQPWRDEAEIALRGRVRSQPLPLPWVHSHSQARRLAKRRAMRLNAAVRGTIETNLYGLVALGERWLRVQVPEYADLADAVIEITGNPRIDLQAMRMTFPFVGINPNEIDAWDAATEEGAPPVIADKLAAAPPPVLTGLAAFYHSPGDDAQIAVTFTNPARGDLTYQVRHRADGTADPWNELGQQGSQTFSFGRFGVSFHIDAFPPDPVNREVQVRAYAPTGAPSAYSSSAVAPWPPV